MNGAPTLISISLSPQGATIDPGQTLQFTATGYFSDGTTQDLTASMMWFSSLPEAATIDRTGRATGVAWGKAVISAIPYGGSGMLNPGLGAVLSALASLGH